MKNLCTNEVFLIKGGLGDGEAKAIDSAATSIGGAIGGVIGFVGGPGGVAAGVAAGAAVGKAVGCIVKIACCIFGHHHRHH